MNHPPASTIPRKLTYRLAVMADDAPSQDKYFFLIQLLLYTHARLRVSLTVALSCVATHFAADPCAEFQACLRHAQLGRLTVDDRDDVDEVTREHNATHEQHVLNLAKYLKNAYVLAHDQQVEIIRSLKSGELVSVGSDDATRADLLALLFAWHHHALTKDLADCTIQGLANADAPPESDNPNNFKRKEVIALHRIIGRLRERDVHLDREDIRQRYQQFFDEVGTPVSAADFRSMVEEVIVNDAVRLPLLVPNWVLAPLILASQQLALQLSHSGPSPPTPFATAHAPLAAALAPFVAASAPSAAALAPFVAAPSPAPSLAATADQDADTPLPAWTISDAELLPAVLAAAQGTDLYGLDLQRQPMLLLRPSQRPLPDVTRMLCGMGSQSLAATMFSPTVPGSAAPAAPAAHMSATSMPAARQQLGSARATADALVDSIARYILSDGPYTAAQDATFLGDLLTLLKMDASQELPLTYQPVKEVFDIIRVRRPDLELLPGLLNSLSPTWPANEPSAADAPAAKKPKLDTVTDLVAHDAKTLQSLHERITQLESLVFAHARVTVGTLQVVQGRKLHPIDDLVKLVDTAERRFTSRELQDAADLLYDIVTHGPHDLGSFQFDGTPSSLRMPAASADAGRTPHFVKPSNEPTLDSHSDVNDFFVKYELYSSIARIPPAERINRALLCIKSAAVVNQWLAYVRDLQHTPTWQEFQDQIRLYTNGHCTADKALDSLSQCVQGGQPMDKYIAKYTRLVSLAALDTKSSFVIRGFVRGIADDSIRTILNDGPAHNQLWDSLSAVTARAAKLATAKFGGKPASSTRTAFTPRKHHDTPSHKKWQRKPYGKGFRPRADRLNKLVNESVTQSVNAAMESFAQQPAYQLPPQPAFQPMAAPAMHMGYGGGSGYNGSGRGGYNPRGAYRRSRGGRDKRNYQDDQQQRKPRGDGDGAAGGSGAGGHRSRYSA